MQKIIIPLFGNDVAPRFDLASEVVIISCDKKGGNCEERVLVLPKSSAEQLCHLILTEEAQTLICGGIEEEYYQYLTWKQVNVLDSVIGDWRHVLQVFKKGRLRQADIIMCKQQD
jgi:predicted Fe-Mo cluster-binding NifX family protein